MKESSMVDEILGKLKGDPKAAISEARRAQGELEQLVCDAFKKFENATGMQIRYVNVQRVQTKEEKSKGSGCSIASYNDGAIKLVTFDVNVPKA